MAKKEKDGVGPFDRMPATEKTTARATTRYGKCKITKTKKPKKPK